MACFIITGEIMGRENMADLFQNYHQFFPVIILPVTSVSQNFPKFQDNLHVSFFPRCVYQHYDQLRYLNFHSQIE